MSGSDFAAAMLVALALEAAIGWPEGLYRRIGHPVSWLGALIAAGERRWNTGPDSAGFCVGALLALAVIAGAAALAAILAAALPGGAAGTVLAGVLAWPLVAARSLHEHVADVARPLSEGDLESARAAISKIVGRNPETLDAAAMGRASLESLAENASDGVVAPLFWGALLGLPGIAAYKAVNTLDSMIGYRNARYERFGKAAARIDDVANLIPARLTGALIAAGAKARGTAFRTMLRDARAHRSPNAGWPEAAMAGALGVRLSGPRVYDGVATQDPWLNGVGGDPRPEDVVRGLEIYRRAVALMALLLLLAAVT
jgi:adenosylcobinamide-phosphate synthase